MLVALDRLWTLAREAGVRESVVYVVGLSCCLITEPTLKPLSAQCRIAVV